MSFRTKAKEIQPGELRHITVAHETKATEDDTTGKYAGYYEGIGAGIWNIDLGGDLIPGGAFKETLPDFLKDGVIGWQHDITNPIGIPLDAKEMDEGLWNRARVSKTSLGLDAMILIKDKVVKKQSIGYRPLDWKVVDRDGLVAYLDARSDVTGAKVRAILRQYDELDINHVFILEKIKLYEISPVTLPMNPATSIDSAKLLTDGLLAGLPMKDLSAATLAVVRGYFERCKQIQSLREKKDGTIGNGHKDNLEESARLLVESAEEIRSFLSVVKGEAPPASLASGVNVRAEFAKFQEINARANGVFD